MMHAGLLQQLQSLPLDIKIAKTKLRIREWYEHYDGNVYVAFSGGKDSTVLLNIVRSMYPNVQAVFVDTGLEYPEIREFVATVPNVVWLKPRHNFREVIEKYGYPVISKEQAGYIEHKDVSRLSAKWTHLLDAPFKISAKCCKAMKIAPIKKYVLETGKQGMIGVMAVESRLRRTVYITNGGCNSFQRKKAMPMGFWVESDVWAYLHKYEVPYCKIYDMGYDRTGCMFCMFGMQFETPGNTRFDRMKVTHPKQYDYCMNQLGLSAVIDYVSNGATPAGLREVVDGGGLYGYTASGKLWSYRNNKWVKLQTGGYSYQMHVNGTCVQISKEKLKLRWAIAKAEDPLPHQVA